MQVGILFKILDNKFNGMVYFFHTVPLDRLVRPGKPLVAVNFKLPTEILLGRQVPPGSLGPLIEGKVSDRRSGVFTIQPTCSAILARGRSQAIFAAWLEPVA